MDVFIDVETTGFGPGSAVVEVGLAWAGGQWSSRMWPGEGFFLEGRADKAQAVHAISKEVLAREFPSMFIWGQATAVLESLRAWGDGPFRFISWNEQFDRGFLEREAGMAQWLAAEMEEGRVTWACAMTRAAKAAGRTTGRMSLSTGCEAWGITHDESQAHGAQYDVLRCQEVWLAMDAA